ncbi:MAG: ABC transporter permease [Chloroflexota bacterium]
MALAPTVPAIDATDLEETASPRDHPIRSLVLRRLGLGVVSVAAVGFILYWATLILPGDAATAILGQSATPERVALLREQLGLDKPPVQAFFTWAANFLQGDFGVSLAQNKPVTELVWQRLPNSMVLVVVAAVVSSLLGVVLGVLVAPRRDGIVDQILSIIFLVTNAMPEFVVGVFVVIVFSVKVFHWFPAVSVLSPGTYVWQSPEKLVLPVLTLILVTTPYIFRMTRGTMIEALNSDYAELARLKGVPSTRMLFRHALPNALPPAIQAIGLNLLYLAGGIVLVEKVFNFPGIGLLLVDAIGGRDVPVIQFIVILLAATYVLINLVADVAVLLVTPRRRYPRS